LPGRLIKKTKIKESFSTAMNEFDDEYKDLIIQLTKAGVCFIIAGGFAVIYHGYVRTTGDLDIWLRPDNMNREKLLQVLADKGFRKTDIEKLRKTDFTKALAFHYGELPQRVDFLTKLTGIDFDECLNNAVYLQMDKYKIPVLNFKNLVLNKMLSGRPKDKADVDELQKIMKLKEKRKK
jgi:hypothetical protein